MQLSHATAMTALILLVALAAGYAAADATQAGETPQASPPAVSAPAS